MNRYIKRYKPREAFTLVEVLVVVGIIAVLMTVLVFSIGKVVTSTRVKATRATIMKIQGLLDARVRAFDQAFEKNQFRNEIQVKEQTLVGGGMPLTRAQQLAPILVRKEKFKQLFPQSYAETGTSPPGGHLPETESSEILYAMLTQGTILGIPPVGEDEFSTNEVQDTDEDGRKEFVDAWGTPLRFYRWPTRMIRPGSSGASADANTPVNEEVVSLLMPNLNMSVLTSDPDDPAYKLKLTTGYTPDWMEQNYHTELTYHPSLIVSAGPDKELGLYEPMDQGNYGHLARPTDEVLTAPGDSVLNDNITNRQQ